MRREDITAVVLCGGSAARLGSVDKTLLEVDGHPLVGYTLEALRPQIGGFVLSCGRDPAPYRRFGYPVTPDHAADEGPLGGIVSANGAIDSEWILTHPGDTPLPDPQLVARLTPAAERAGVAVPRTGAYRQHLVMLVSRGWLESLAQHYAQGGRAGREWLDAAGAEEVDMADIADSFFNVNTFEDLAQAKRRLHHPT